KFDQIITADDAVKERFQAHHPQVDVLYNFSDFEAKPAPDLAKEYDVIYQGGITLERGAYNLVQTIRILRDKFPKIKMIFVGPFDDPEGKGLVEQYIQEH